MHDRETRADGVRAGVLEARAAVHRALGDVHRLALVDALWVSDRSPSELATITGLGSNLLAFHLGVLEEVGVVARTRSEGDARRRYVRLRPDALPQRWPAAGPTGLRADDVLFVCTANSARSQLAAALWERRTGRAARSAGHRPAARVHPGAVAVGRRLGIDLGDRTPSGYDAVDRVPDLVVSVCDRAREAGLPFDVPTLHWSVPDPVSGPPPAFDAAADQLAARIDALAADVEVAA